LTQTRVFDRVAFEGEDLSERKRVALENQEIRIQLRDRSRVGSVARGPPPVRAGAVGLGGAEDRRETGQLGVPHDRQAAELDAHLLAVLAGDLADAGGVLVGEERPGVERLGDPAAVPRVGAHEPAAVALLGVALELLVLRLQGVEELDGERLEREVLLEDGLDGLLRQEGVLSRGDLAGVDELEPVSAEDLLDGGDELVDRHDDLCRRGCVVGAPPRCPPRVRAAGATSGGEGRRRPPAPSLTPSLRGATPASGRGNRDRAT
jgi:hypothetical protein